MTLNVVAEIERNYIYNLVRHGKRLDGRELEEMRPLHLEINPMANAEGSARAHLGKTDVVVGVKTAVGEPFPDTPDQGVLTTVAELRPIAYEYFEAGPPDPVSIELARVVDRGIRESNAVNLLDLCIVPGEKVWVIFIDIHVIDFDGNLIDATGIAALAALMNTTVPASAHALGDDFRLPVEHYPIPVTCAKLRQTIVVDPNEVEETVADARLTVTTDEEGRIRAMQKGFHGAFTRDEIEYIIDLSGKISNRTRELMGLKP